MNQSINQSINENINQSSKHPCSYLSRKKQAIDATLEEIMFVRPSVTLCSASNVCCVYILVSLIISVQDERTPLDILHAGDAESIRSSKVKFMILAYRGMF